MLKQEFKRWVAQRITEAVVRPEVGQAMREWEQGSRRCLIHLMVVDGEWTTTPPAAGSIEEYMCDKCRTRTTTGMFAFVIPVGKGVSPELIEAEVNAARIRHLATRVPVLLGFGMCGKCCRAAGMVHVMDN